MQPIIQGPVVMLPALFCCTIGFMTTPEQKPQPVQPEIILPGEQPPEKPRTVIPESPVHPLSSFVTIVIDGIWGILQIEATLSVVLLPTLLPTILISGLTCALTVALVQRHVGKDSWGAAIAKGLVLGVAAGVPYPVTGTALGGVLLGWAGLNEVENWIRQRRLPPGG